MTFSLRKVNAVLSTAGLSHGERIVAALMLEEATISPNGVVISAWRMRELSGTADIGTDAISKARRKLQAAGLAVLIERADPRAGIPAVWSLNGLVEAVEAVDRG